MSYLNKSMFVLAIGSLIIACGDETDGPSAECGFEDRYLPYQ